MRDHGICHICKRPGADTADHLDPVSEHGPALPPPERLAAAHRSCNSRRARLRERQARAVVDELDEEGTVPLPRPRERRPGRPPRIWVGALDFPFTASATVDVVKPGGIVVRVKRGQRYVP